MSPEPAAPSGVRLDKWLWAARFFKTRGTAANAIERGKVQVNGHRAKRSKLVHVGDEVHVRRGPYDIHAVVRGLSERRGPAKEAVKLYEETEESKEAYTLRAEHLKLAASVTKYGKGRPTKRDRRDLARIKGEWWWEDG